MERKALSSTVTVTGISSVLTYCCCCCSLAKSYQTFLNCLDCSMPGFPVPHHLLEFALIHVHWIGQSVVRYKVLTVASWPAYRFLRRKVRWPGIPISLRVFQFFMIHTVKGFSIVNETEVDVFLKFLFFLCDLVSNLIFWFFWSFLNPVWASGISQFT